MLIYLNLQTTGLEADDKICSVALIVESEDKKSVVEYELINEGKKIPPLASSIHHITNEMIESAPSFVESRCYEILMQHNHIDTTLILHSAKFDLEKLSEAGVKWRGGVVDTLRVTKHLIPECELFSLQVLRYELKLYKEESLERELLGVKEELCAHNALGNVLVGRALFKYLLQMNDIEVMLELSYKSILIQKFEFGKYKGHYIEEIAMNDRGYLEWMLSSMDSLDEDLRYSIVYNLEGNL